jgi:tetratricopeptide (TPR) repeat protein
LLSDNSNLGRMSVSDIQTALDLLQDKEFDAAISRLERTVSELPAHLPAHILLARAYESKGRWDDALHSWENAHFLMPNSPTVVKGKQRVLRRIEEDGAEPEAVSGADDPGRDASGPSAVPSQAPPSDDAEGTPSREAPSPGASARETSRPPSETEPSETEPSQAESSEAESTASKALSELDELRRRAEAEARQGGARPGLHQQRQDQQRQDQQQEQRDAEQAAEKAPDAASGSPEERAEEGEDDVTGDLDRLIRELESARIEPRPEPEEDVDEMPEPDLEDEEIDDLVSETLARIYAAQDQYQEAARIYVKLASQEPGRARDHLQKAAEMREKAGGE